MSEGAEGAGRVRRVGHRVPGTGRAGGGGRAGYQVKTAQAGGAMGGRGGRGGGGWAPGRQNSRSTERRSWGSRPPGRRSYGRRRTARSLWHRRWRSTERRSREPGGHQEEECLVAGVGRSAGGGGSHRACAMRTSFSRARRRPTKVAGGIETLKNTGPFTGYRCGLMFGPNPIN
jgi:hypothetical protein